MRIKNFKQFESTHFNSDVDFAMAKIVDNFSEETISEMVDKELLNWANDEFGGKAEQEYDFDLSNYREEAIDVVITNIINWYMSEFDRDISEKEYDELFFYIRRTYKALN